MRTITIKIPDTYCNDCVFFATADPDPEMCTGCGGLRRYWCSLFKEQLYPDYNTKPVKINDWETWVHKAKVCDKCKIKYK